MRKSISLLVVIALGLFLTTVVAQGESSKLLWVEDWESYSTIADMEKSGWSIYGSVGLGELTDNINHTKGGKFSLKVGDGSAARRPADSGNYITGKVTAWMYCPQDSGSRRASIFLWNDYGHEREDDYLRICVFEIWSPTHFIVVRKGDEGFVPLWVKATKGWHEITVDVKSSGTKVYINGMEVYSTPNFTYFSKIMVGGTHIGTVPIYIDDIRVEKYGDVAVDN